MPFTAQYPTTCRACWEPVAIGDVARYNSQGAVVHETCPEPKDELAVTREPCTRCFQVPAANGTCGCD